MKLNIFNSAGFKKALRKDYGLNSERAQEEWDKALRDPKIRKGQDLFGNRTVAKLFTQTLSQGRKISNLSKVSEKVAKEITDQDDLKKLSEGQAFNS